MMVEFIDQSRESWGVEPICDNLPIAPATYYSAVAGRRDPSKLSALRRRDDELRPHIQRLFDDSTRRYGARKVWRELKREGRAVARCTVERLMRQMGLVGVSRGRKSIRTTWSDPNNPTPEDLVQRDFHAERPNQLWVADFTYVATWSGWVFVAFIIDAFAKTIVGWRAATRMTAELTLDALEQAIWARPVNAGLVHHSDHGSQYLAIRYSERLADEGITPSAGTVGDAYDNALAETINGLYKTEVIRHLGPWKGLDDVEYATLEWVHWYNTKRLMSSIGYVPPAEYEQAYYTEQKLRLVESGLTQ
jgi:transposase InsO family protein